MYSILIIEDHALFGNAIRRLLTGQSGIEVVDIVPSSEEALKKLPALKVDLVLVDVSLPSMNGIDLVQRIRADFPDQRCLMLSGHMTPYYVKRSLDAGACGYVLKDDVRGILEAIQQVQGGVIYVSQSLRGNGAPVG